jgi:photosystem II stability/assembly factor-like uncharacterized protein
MTDSLERLLYELRFEVPASLVERAKVNASDGEVTHGLQMQSRRRSTAIQWPRLSNLPALIAALLAIATVATLLLIAHGHQAARVAPAAPNIRPAAPYSPPSPPTAPASCSAVAREWASPSPNPAKMLSATTGWAYGPMRTTDGGLHWIDVSPPSIPGRTNKNDEFFLDATHAWVAETTTSSSACIDHVVIFRTADGGHTWQQQDDPPLPVWPNTPASDVLWTGSNNHAHLLDFIDPQNGWLLLGTGPANSAPAGVSSSWIGSAWRTGSVWNTNDGGATWAVAPNPFAVVGCVPTSGALVKATLSFSSPSDGWILASCEASAYPANLLVTHDAGASWSRATTPLSPEEAPVFFDSKHGAAKATGGLIVTSDGGATWTIRQNAPGSYGVDFINRNDAWSIGPGDNAPLQCPGPNDKACNGNFRLYYTHDGGVTWTPGARTSLTMMAPKWWPPAYLHFVDSKTGFVDVGEDPTERGLYVTHDGGQTWTKVNATIQGR